MISESSLKISSTSSLQVVSEDPSRPGTNRLRFSLCNGMTLLHPIIGHDLKPFFFSREKYSRGFPGSARRKCATYDAYDA